MHFHGQNRSHEIKKNVGKFSNRECMTQINSILVVHVMMSDFEISQAILLHSNHTSNGYYSVQLNLGVKQHFGLFYYLQ